MSFPKDLAEELNHTPIAIHYDRLSYVFRGICNNCHAPVNEIHDFPKCSHCGHDLKWYHNN